MMLLLALISVVLPVAGGAVIAWQRRKLKRELDAKWPLLSDGSGVETWEQLRLLVIYRRYLLRPPEHA
jgi:hypothetical protein